MKKRDRRPSDRGRATRSTRMACFAAAVLISSSTITVTALGVRVEISPHQTQMTLK